MKIKDHKDGKIIQLSAPFDSREKGLYLIYFMVFFATGTIFIKSFIDDLDGATALTVVCIITGIFYIIAYKFANKAIQTEKMFVNKEQLDIIKKGLFTSKTQSFDITKISKFRHLAKPALPKHPLAAGHMDYLGFQTQQTVINEMHGDNRLAFDYKGRTITFGNNIYSWDFEELEILLYDITGNDFRYDDDFEKTFGSND